MNKSLISELRKFGISESEIGKFTKKKLLSFSELYEAPEEKKTIETKVGPQGPRGFQGLRGEPGLIGPQGLQGAEGSKGLDGTNGLSGKEGTRGHQGEKGLAGKVGDVGPQGPTGDIGPQGESGEQGIDGKDGDIGHQGPQGIDGSDGIQGPQGDIGPQGESILISKISEFNDELIIVDDVEKKEYELKFNVTPNSEFVFLNNELINPSIDYQINNNIITLNESWKLKLKNKIRIKYLISKD